MATAELILWDVIEEHFDEAEFLFELWQSALGSPNYTLNEIASLVESRLVAHIDGLLIGGEPVAERILFPALEEDDEPEQAAIATLVLLETGDRSLRNRVLETLPMVELEQQEGIARGLALSDTPNLDLVLTDRFEHAQSPELKAIWLDILAERYADPGPQLAQCLTSEHLPLVRSALKAASRTGQRQFSQYADFHVHTEEFGLREVAIETGLLWGTRDSWQMCKHLANIPNDFQGRAMLLAALLGGRTEHQLLLSVLDKQDCPEEAISALGYTGNIACADRCASLLRDGDERKAKLAAEALSIIGGFDIYDDHFVFEEEPDEAAEELEALPDYEDDDLDADLVPDNVDELPVPKVEAIEEWWHQNRLKFSAGTRYLEGEKHTPEKLRDCLEKSSMRRRHALALELRIRTAGMRYLPTDTFSERQKQRLSKLSTLKKQDLVNFPNPVW